MLQSSQFRDGGKDAMFCVKCGAKIPSDSVFCTSCGEKTATEVVEGNREGRGKLWTRKKAALLILVSVALTSVCWVFIWGTDVVSTEDEAVNIIVHLVETLGRQTQAWDKTERAVDLILYGFSDECVSDPNCVDNTVGSVTTLLAEVEKEKEEIGNLWSEEVLGRDMASYFSRLGGKSLNKILDVFNIYFPEEVEDLEQSELRLLRR